MISIVIPALNEQDAIGQTIEQIDITLRQDGIENYEIIVVDDGSSDDTFKHAESAGAKVLRHPHNVGYGRSLKSGISAATYDTIVITDADLTYPANAIPKLLDKLDEGFDMVVGARTGHFYSGSVFKGPLRKILKWLVEFTAGRDVPDANSGLRVFRKSTITEYFAHLCDTFSFTTSLTLAYMLTGRFVTYIPIDYHERVGTTKVRLFKDSMRTLQYIAQSIVYYNPIKFFVVVSGCCVLLSAIAFLVGAITGFNAPYFLGIGGVLVALLVFCLGLLADLLRQILVR